jgi:hypothetical protein
VALREAGVRNIDRVETRRKMENRAEMTNPQKVYAFLRRNKHQGFCDDCLAKETGVDRHEVNTIALTLALFHNEFARSTQTCPQGCSAREKLITHSK